MPKASMLPSAWSDVRAVERKKARNQIQAVEVGALPTADHHLDWCRGARRVLANATYATASPNTRDMLGGSAHGQQGAVEGKVLGLCACVAV